MEAMKKHIVCIVLLILAVSLLCSIENVYAKSTLNDSTEQWRMASSITTIPSCPPIYAGMPVSCQAYTNSDSYKHYISSSTDDKISYFSFQPSGRQRTVEGARIVVFKRTNVSPTPVQVLLSLKVYTLQGEYISTASSQVFNIQNLPLLEWVEIPLTQNDMDRSVHQNEVLTFEVYIYADTAQGNFSSTIAFEVDMESFESGDKSKVFIGDDVIIGEQ